MHEKCVHRPCSWQGEAQGPGAQLSQARRRLDARCSTRSRGSGRRRRGCREQNRCLDQCNWRRFWHKPAKSSPPLLMHSRQVFWHAAKNPDSNASNVSRSARAGAVTSLCARAMQEPCRSQWQVECGLTWLLAPLLGAQLQPQLPAGPDHRSTARSLWAVSSHAHACTQPAEASERKPNLACCQDPGGTLSSPAA